jgi:hypothetical protein
MLAIAQPGLDLPEYVLAGLKRHGASVRPAAPSEVDAVVPGRALPALAITPGPRPFDRGPIDAIYVTRLQRERLTEGQGAAGLPPVDSAFLAAPGLERAVVMHPLPRTSEIDPAIDSDPRAAYFRQAAAGVPVRMALLSWALGKLPRAADAGAPNPRSRRPPAAGPRRNVCSERTCISVREPSTAAAEWFEAADGTVRCVYCETPVSG